MCSEHWQWNKIHKCNFYIRKHSLVLYSDQNGIRWSDHYWHLAFIIEYAKNKTSEEATIKYLFKHHMSSAKSKTSKQNKSSISTIKICLLFKNFILSQSRYTTHYKLGQVIRRNKIKPNDKLNFTLSANLCLSSST